MVLFFSHIWVKLSVSSSVIEGLDTADVFKPLHWHLFAVAPCQNLCVSLRVFDGFTLYLAM